MKKGILACFALFAALISCAGTGTGDKVTSSGTATVAGVSTFYRFLR
jgi:hypothetical protein